MLAAGLWLPAGPIWAAIGAVAVIGVGIGLAWGHIARFVFEAAGDADRHRVTTVMPTIQSLGIAFGSVAAGPYRERVRVGRRRHDRERSHCRCLALFRALACRVHGASRRSTRGNRHKVTAAARTRPRGKAADAIDARRFGKGRSAPAPGRYAVPPCPIRGVRRRRGGQQGLASALQDCLTTFLRPKRDHQACTAITA